MDALQPEDMTPQAVALARQLADAGRVVIRLCDGGEKVANGIAASACDYCSGGVCRQMEACDHSQPST